jgi:ABC-type transport system involved in multi-copper enzyme maturation permease subunit
MTAPQAPATFDDRHARTSLAHTVRSEWTKIWSVRSTFWTLLTLIISTVGISILASWGTSTHLSQMNATDRANLDVTYQSMGGLSLGQLAIAVLGVLIITSEYSTGGIKTTLTAVPNRIRVLLAKGIVFAIIATIVGVITTFGAFYASMPFWAHQHLAVDVGDPGVLRAIIGGGLYVLASGMFGFALGAVIRHTAGAITAAVALLLIAPPLTNLLPGSWGDTVTKYFTSNAGSRVAAVVNVPDQATPWVGYLAITIWWVVPLLFGAWLMRTRDA